MGCFKTYVELTDNIIMNSLLQVSMQNDQYHSIRTITYITNFDYIICSTSSENVCIVWSSNEVESIL